MYVSFCFWCWTHTTPLTRPRVHRGLPLYLYTWVTPDRCVHGAGVGTAAAVAKSCQGPSVAGYSATPCPELRVKTSKVLEEEDPARLGQLLQERTRARRCKTSSGHWGFNLHTGHLLHPHSPATRCSHLYQWPRVCEDERVGLDSAPVSYTHLTLPTILRV